jgi:hypothetical protein
MSTPDRSAVFYRKSLGGVAKDSRSEIDKQSPLFTIPSLTPDSERGSLIRSAIVNLKLTTGPKPHNLPKERYLPAEVTPETRSHMPRRGIELKGR